MINWVYNQKHPAKALVENTCDKGKEVNKPMEASGEAVISIEGKSVFSKIPPNWTVIRIARLLSS